MKVLCTIGSPELIHSLITIYTTSLTHSHTHTMEGLQPDNSSSTAQVHLHPYCLYQKNVN